ncbi:hypothetical protein BGZ60DRAFT_521628 [Tricladium varicosporioides]|nr:hypothetical protein BGZ60DRAFT_521628 [Hymenoscyphus varicosporioides]
MAFNAPGTLINVRDLAQPKDASLTHSPPTEEISRRLRAPGGGENGNWPFSFELPLPSNFDPMPESLSSAKILSQAVWAVKSWESYKIENGKATRDMATFLSKMKVEDIEVEAGGSLSELKQATNFITVSTAGYPATWQLSGLGATTWLSIQGSPDQDTLIQLAFVDLEALSKNAKKKALKDFAEKGRKWGPKKDWVSRVPLKRGDTWVMGPGTIYAVWSLTDSVVCGGLVMRGKELRTSLSYWKVGVEKGLEARVSGLMQARRLVDVLRDTAKKNLEACGFKGEEGLVELEKSWRVIAEGAGVKCGCKGACEESCICFENTQRCSACCHLDGGACNNPFGCENDVR